MDVQLSQDYESLGELHNGGTTTNVGTLLRRTRDGALGVSFVWPRVRTYSSVSMGVGAEHRSFLTDPGELLVQLDTNLRRSYTYPRAYLGARFSNVQRPPLAISVEDGVGLAFTLRERYRTGAVSGTASTSIVGAASGYRHLDLPGFAHHVIALRAAGGYADGKTATSLEVGGTSGTTVSVVSGYTLGEGRRTFGVRGFPSASVFGTRAVTGSAEYRAPLVLGGRGLGLLPVVFDRSALTVFADAGAAGCAAAPLYVGICSQPARLNTVIASVGAELGVSAGVFIFDAAELVRIGVAVPVAGRALTGAKAASVYLAFGPSF